MKDKRWRIPEHTSGPAEELSRTLGCSTLLATLLEHPNLAPLVASRPLPQENWRASVIFGVALFRAAGFDPETIPLAADAMVGFALGFIVNFTGISVANVGYNGSMPVNGSTTFGFLGAWNGTNAVPVVSDSTATERANATTRSVA